MKPQIAAVCAMLALAGLAAPAAAHLIRGSVVGCGGTRSVGMTGATHTMYGTVAQAAVGLSNGTAHMLCHGFWCFGGSRVVSVDPPGGARLPTEFALGPTTPNPARGSVRFHLSLPKAGQVTLMVYDVAGRQVGGTVSQELPAGESELYWRAPGDRSGIYFMRLAADGIFKAERTIVLVR